MCPRRGSRSPRPRIGSVTGIAVPAIPVDAICAFLGTCRSLGEEPFASDDRVVGRVVGREALEALADVVRRAHPMSLASNPPTILDRMANSDEIAYVPLAFGYANYARSGFARRQLRFAPGPGTATSAGAPIVPSGTLGGAGLAVSSSTAHPEAACAYTAFTASGQVQRTTYAEGGGQPAHREAWTDRQLNDESGAFFASTLGALDEAYLRPRFDGFLGFQDGAGDLVHGYLRTGEGADRGARRARRVVPCEPRDDGGSGSMTMALEGIRVLDFTQMMMGPWATQFLGDMGADVIKIERPGVGEWERGLRAMGDLLDGQSPFFLAMNRNKRSVALNLKDPRAREIVLRLAGDVRPRRRELPAGRDGPPRSRVRRHRRGESRDRVRVRERVRADRPVRRPPGAGPLDPGDLRARGLRRASRRPPDAIGQLDRGRQHGAAVGVLLDGRSGPQVAHGRGSAHRREPLRHRGRVAVPGDRGVPEHGASLRAERGGGRERLALGAVRDLPHVRRPPGARDGVARGRSASSWRNRGSRSTTTHDAPTTAATRCTGSCRSA